MRTQNKENYYYFFWIVAMVAFIVPQVVTAYAYTKLADYLSKPVQVEVLLYSLLVQDRIQALLDIMVLLAPEEHIIYTVILAVEVMVAVAQVAILEVIPVAILEVILVAQKVAQMAVVAVITQVTQDMIMSSDASYLKLKKMKTMRVH